MALNEVEVVSKVEKGLFIGGKWIEATGGKSFVVEDPSTRKTICEVADASVDDAMAALDAAHAAFEAWAATPPRYRGEIIRRAYEIIMARSEELALIMTLEMGKPLAEARGEVAYAADFFRWFAEEAVRIDGRFYVAPDGNSRVLTMKQPVGVAYMITPWNFPLAMATRKMGPALAAGATVILKPAEQTPLCSLALASILEEAGLPAGVVNVVTTSDPAGISEALMNDDRLRKVSFTGSTEVGKILAERAGRRLLRVSMELGGNAPFIVFDDADIDLAVGQAMIAKMRNMGEACTSANRFLVDAKIANEFSEKLADRMAHLNLGRGTETDTNVGPLIDQAAIDKVTTLVSDAVANGAAILTGGRANLEDGYFFEPTVIVGTSSNSAISKNEIFGPVASVVTFNDEAEAIELANGTEYGLVAYVFTNNLSRGLRVIESLKTGMVGLNQGLVSNAAAPFGGVKDSGFGREGGFEGIEEYLDLKYIAINHRA
ncbi:MAG: NAD-dependent succinate-semialdehyde dehydrogenase [Actinomycetota bacterium]|nr:NAD-dependent succinate-semialdehyde dehydrogenase [Actinomycetota bacterium]